MQLCLYMFSLQAEVALGVRATLLAVSATDPFVRIVDALETTHSCLLQQQEFGLCCGAKSIAKASCLGSTTMYWLQADCTKCARTNADNSSGRHFGVLHTF